MPFVHVQTLKGIMTAAQKAELLERITDVMVEVEGRGDPAFRPYVWVRLEEAEPENWILGGCRATRRHIELLYGENR